MKANEAPEKIYLQDSMSTDTIGDLWPEWFDAKVSDNSIEYVRKDAFIDKALEWINKNAFRYICNFKYKGVKLTSLDASITEDFKKYMEK